MLDNLVCPISNVRIDRNVVRVNGLVGCVVYTYIALPLYRARDAVRAIPLFGALDEPMLASLAEGFESVEMAEGERLVTEGDPGDEMFVIRSGEVESYREDGHGSRKVLVTCKARDYFGEMALLTGNPRSTPGWPRSSSAPPRSAWSTKRRNPSERQKEERAP